MFGRSISTFKVARWQKESHSATLTYRLRLRFLLPTRPRTSTIEGIDKFFSTRGRQTTDATLAETPAPLPTMLDTSITFTRASADSQQTALPKSVGLAEYACDHWTPTPKLNVPVVDEGVAFGRPPDSDVSSPSARSPRASDCAVEVFGALPRPPEKAAAEKAAADVLPEKKTKRAVRLQAFS